jgi:asparagine N-glycosylation enzyme membrane subunit Stt3
MHNTTISFQINKKTVSRLVLFVSIGLALALGVFLRVEDLIAWRQQPQAAFYKETPLLTTFDGYYYARFARDLVEGTYKALDEFRAVPQTPPRPMPPPLLSLLVAGVAKLTGASVDWVSTFFPAVFGVLLFFPLFLIGRLWGNHLAGFVAGFIALCSPYYVNRSRLGWLDTDCGNVTFTMLAVYLAVKTMTSQGRRQLWYLAGFLANFLLFLLWWDQTPSVVVAICLGTLLLSWVCETKSFRQNLFPVLVAMLSTIVVMIFLRGVSFWTGLVSHLWGHLQYISKASPGDFPNIGQSISEQVHIPLHDVVQISAGNWFIFIPAVLGLILLFVRSLRRGLQLLIPIGMGGLAIFTAKRFAIFLAPLIGLGIGYLLYWLRDQIALLRSPLYLWKTLFIGACLVLPIGLSSLVLGSIANTFWPVEPPPLIHGMDMAREKTPPGSVIWAWWDHGYPMLYWSRRGAISDGEFHDGELAMINAFSLATTDYQQSANWMQFYVARGIPGFHRVYEKLGGTAQGLNFIRKVLAAGPDKAASMLEEQGLKPKDQWLSFFFPSPQERRPLYLFLDERLVGTSYWWYWLGSWDVVEQDGEHPFYNSFIQVKRNGNVISGNPPFSIDLDQGAFSAQKTAIPLSKIVFRDGDQWQETIYRDVGMIFEYDAMSGWGVLCSPEVQDSVFNKLFFMGMADIRYFKPVFLRTGLFHIWEVLGAVPAKTEGDSPTRN